MAEEEGKINILLYMGEDFQGWEPEALWDDFKLALGKLRKDFERFALVGGPRWVQVAAKLDTCFMSNEMKTFSIDQLQEAWDWIKS